jgi:ABC-2 type transport system ATP-binding protein
MIPVIESQHLSKTYGNVTALDDVSLHVPRHSITGFLGPNGAGKTTLLKIMMGLARPTRGSARILGMDVVRESIQVRQHVGYLPQEIAFYPHLTARQALRFVAGLYGTGSDFGLEKHINMMLDLVNLRDKADRPVSDFSGGERQRLGLAQAWIHQPEVLILDEPTAALDPIGRRQVLSIMGRLKEKTTIFYSTHILEDVQRVSDHVAILNHGKLAIQSPLSNLLTEESAVDPKHSHYLEDVFLRTIEGEAA